MFLVAYDFRAHRLHVMKAFKSFSFGLIYTSFVLHSKKLEGDLYL
jgi:hypothetical protein